MAALRGLWSCSRTQPSLAAMSSSRNLRSLPAVLLASVVSITLAGCGGSDGNSGGGDPCSIPVLDRLCPPPGYGNPPFVGQPSIQSFTVSPTEIRPGQPVTLTAEFTGSGSVLFVRSAVWVNLWSGMPLTVVPSVSENTVEEVKLQVWGLVESRDPSTLYDTVYLTTTATFTVRGQ
jgi:hypothetical protein